MNEPPADTAGTGLNAIGSLLACTSGALVAVQVGLWVASRYAPAFGGGQPLWSSLVLSAGMLVLGVVTFATALALLAQRHPTGFGRRTAVWAGVGFLAMIAWAVGIPMLRAI